jgi:adenine-specific DNA-methyltransferase
MFDAPPSAYQAVILNPPYKKINASSRTRKLLRRLGIETSNWYSAFLWLSFRLLEPGGELISITPRSFCNGPYFKPFRLAFLREMAISHLHLFDSRTAAFGDSDVLQESVIMRAVKRRGPNGKVRISSSIGPGDPDITLRSLEPAAVVSPTDPDRVVHLVPDELGALLAERMRSFKTNLTDLELQVSTGRVVDFRAREFLANGPGAGRVPLVYPTHCGFGKVDWPKGGRKPDYFVRSQDSEDLLVPAGNYVLVKRFSAKEERRRIVAATCSPGALPGDAYAFENHVNYYHSRGRGMDVRLARGLAAYLNSTLVDWHFRQFSGHTQVNAADLRSLPYPSREWLLTLAARVGDRDVSQDELDNLVAEALPPMSKGEIDPVRAKKRVDEALRVLAELGMPKDQCNERSALTLLALLDLKPRTPWSRVKAPLRGITPMMEFFAAHYGKRYAPNTRETVRRQTVHQFLDAGLIVANPDEPDRPINSGKTVYQIEQGALELLRAYRSERWQPALRAWLSSVGTLKEKHARERQMQRIPLVLPGGQRIDLSPGGQNILIKQIVDEFCPRFAPGGQLIYVGDTDTKYAYLDEKSLAALGVSFDRHGKMPDVVVHFHARNWLFLIEAVTSHGPISAKRHGELKRLFSTSSAGLVFVTAFLTRQALTKYQGEISWETEVWIAESPSHLIHFDGERLLGPYSGPAQ